MAKGRDKFEERRAALNAFGKDLARRARSACELCEARGQSLQIYEVPPITAEPDFEHCIMICAACQQQLAGRRLDADHWRSLSQLIWHEVPAIKVLAVAILNKLAVEQQWAAEIQEQVYMDADLEPWLRKLEL